MLAVCASSFCACAGELGCSAAAVDCKPHMHTILCYATRYPTYAMLCYAMLCYALLVACLWRNIDVEVEPVSVG